jgi:uncharacterized protein
MPPPYKRRQIKGMPGSAYFKPRGVPLCMLEEIKLCLEEFEAVRLADFGGLYQKEAADRMGISRQTFSNTVRGARKKIADALVHGKALTIGGAKDNSTKAEEKTISKPCYDGIVVKD